MLKNSNSPARKSSRVTKFSRVSSLVFELELEESVFRDEVDAGAEGALHELSSLVEPWSDAEYKLLQCVRRAQEEVSQRQQSLEPGHLAAQLRQSGFDAKLLSALGGGTGGECLRNLRHTFLSVTSSNGFSTSPRFIVDLNFKEQFEIAQPTERYAKLLAAVPAEFVGTEDRISLLVTFLCREISTAFKAHGKTLPPWRQADSMLSKWRPRRSVEHDVLASSVPFHSPRSCVLPPMPLARRLYA